MMNQTVTLEQEVHTAYRQKRNEELQSPASYVQPHNYSDRFHKERRDVLKFTPFAVMEKFPVQGNEGLYGWTFRHTGKVHLREDLAGEAKIETDLHECAHTPDERETRYRTAERMKAMFAEREKYRTAPEEYRA